MIPIPYPCWRWSADCPEGRVFDTAEDLAAAPGVWVDSPAILVTTDPDPKADVEVSGAEEAAARKRSRKTDAETAELIAQLEEVKK